MSESVEILIKADDKASAEFAAAAANVEKAERKIENVLKSLQSPADRYEAELREITQLHKDGLISAEKFAAAQAGLRDKLSGTGNAYKEVGGKAKASAEFIGVLAAVSGSPEIAGMAGQVGQITEKVGQFSEVSKAGGMGALAFKAGLVGLVGALAVGIGKAIGDVIFQTEKFNRELEETKRRSEELTATLRGMQSALNAEQREDIELIRDPEEKQAAYAQLLETLNRDIATVEGNVRASKKSVDEWNDAWQITGERKASAEMAKVELENDRARLAELNKQRAELQKVTSERAKQNALIREENALKDKSEAYLQSLRDEVELLKATKDERIAIEAARNTTTEDQGEAERLLRERDAILAKAEAEKQLEEDRKRAADEAIAIAEKEAQARKSDVERIEAIIKAEEQRNELRKIELEQGKEAAKVQALINQGIDEQTARKLAADEAALDRVSELKKKSPDEAKEKSTGLIGSGGDAALQAVSGRLLARGPVEKQQDFLAQVAEATKRTARATEDMQGELSTIREQNAKQASITLQGTP